MIRLDIGTESTRPLSAPASTPPSPQAASGTAAPAPEALIEVQDRLGRVLGPRFEVLEPIALGGMATLIQLRHREHGGLLVAKVLHAELLGRPEIIACFRQEAHHAACLGDHPNAIPILDAYLTDELCFLTMPYIEGEDLDRLLVHHGPLSRPEALHFAAQISSLLCHAESHGITHCDLAPGNIRLDVFGRYRLMDFGLSQTLESHPGHHLGGTPLYTSPEQLRGETPDIRADLYALGLILAEVLTGAPVLQASTLDSLREQHLNGTWQLPASVKADPALALLLQRLTALNRDNRFASAYELSGALAALGFERPEFRSSSHRSDPAHLPTGPRRSRLS